MHKSIMGYGSVFVWVSGSWVKWVSFLDGSYGSWVDALSPMTHLHIYRKRADMPPKKKVKHAPDGTDVQSASTTTASTEPLNDRVLKEIRKYETEPLPCHTATDVFDPLYWWEQHEQSYPILSDCARRLLVIPAYSAECERHFSAFKARHIITLQRNLLFPETVEALSTLLHFHQGFLLPIVY